MLEPADWLLKLGFLDWRTIFIECSSVSCASLERYEALRQSLKSVNVGTGSGDVGVNATNPLSGFELKPCCFELFVCRAISHCIRDNFNTLREQRLESGANDFAHLTNVRLDQRLTKKHPDVLRCTITDCSNLDVLLALREQ